jgi:hypothetical protein
MVAWFGRESGRSRWLIRLTALRGPMERMGSGCPSVDNLCSAGRGNTPIGDFAVRYFHG